MHVENKEQMKKMEEQLEKDKLEIKKAFEKERLMIAQQAEMAEEEKHALLE